jgi:hypothetical protein
MPGEISDRVYYYLNNEEFEIADDQDCVEEAAANPEFDCEYVGLDFVYECGKHFYECTLFIVPSHAYMNLEDFLTQDYFRLGLGPSNLVRSIQLTSSMTLKKKFECFRVSEEQLTALSRRKGRVTKIVFNIGLDESLPEVNKLLDLSVQLEELGSFIYKLKADDIAFRLQLSEEEETGHWYSRNITSWLDDTSDESMSKVKDIWHTVGKSATA